MGEDQVEDQEKEIPWERQHKIGIILLVIAVVLPLLVFPFVSGYEKGKGFTENLYRMGIPLQQDEARDAGKPADPIVEAKRASEPPVYVKLTPKRIPFRFFLVVSVILTYMGIVRIDKARRRRKEIERQRNIEGDPQRWSQSSGPGDAQQGRFTQQDKVSPVSRPGARRR